MRANTDAFLAEIDGVKRGGARPFASRDDGAALATPARAGVLIDAQGLGALALGPGFVAEEPRVTASCVLPGVGERVRA
jgi:hypothetical protein